MTNDTFYTDDQREAFCSLAKEIGIAPATRKLGYPSMPTAQVWLKARGITVSLDSLMQNIKKYHVFYQLEDMLTVVETGVARSMEMYVNGDLTADDLQKTATATQKLVSSWQTLQGKASQITENRESDSLDVALVELLNVERLRNGRTAASEASQEPAASVEVSQSAELSE